MLSILIPTYNYDCTKLANDLYRLSSTIDDKVEIIVVDDCSPNMEIVEALKRLDEISICRYIRLPENIGRSAIRNYLTRQARGEWLLYLDSDGGIVRDDFLRRYWEVRNNAMVIEGSVMVPEKCPHPSQSLSYYYEKSVMPRYTADERNKQPYACFKTFNFMARREVMLQIPFNEQFRRYGYEDILFGRHLQLHEVSILHIENPLINMGIEPNDNFLNKVEEANGTLLEFYNELRLNSRIIHCYERLKKWRMVSFIRCIFKGGQPFMRRNLLSAHPSMFLFSCYKLGNFCCLIKQRNK